MLRHIPISTDPALLVGFDTRDDAGVYRLSSDISLVQTVDFFTPVVDDPYAYGQIAAANALSDIYAMGGKPITVLNIACFDPAAAPAEVWAAVLQGAYDKTLEAGAVVLGGHSVEDSQPKFGMAVTGLVDPAKMFANTEARAGDRIFLSKPLGSGIVTTAAKNDVSSKAELDDAVRWMSSLNADAASSGLSAGVRCATDITGFGLAGHMFNVARASKVGIELDAHALPLMQGVERLVLLGCLTGGGRKNAEFLGEQLHFANAVPKWLREVVLDPQTSGGLALFGRVDMPEHVEIGRVVPGEPRVIVR